MFVLLPARGPITLGSLLTQISASCWSYLKLVRELYNGLFCATSLVQCQVVSLLPQVFLLG